MKRLPLLLAALLLSPALYAYNTTPAAHRAFHNRMAQRQEIESRVARAFQPKDWSQRSLEIEEEVKKAFSVENQPATQKIQLPPQHRAIHQQNLSLPRPFLHAEEEKETVKPKPQWQLALFLADSTRPISETLDTLKNRIREGWVHHAVVFDITPRIDANQTPGKEIYPRIFYLLHQEEQAIAVKRWEIETSPASQKLMDVIFKNFQQDNNLYSAVIIDGHGDGFSVAFEEKNTIKPEDILTALEKNNVKLDILNLISCTMGSFYTLYHLSRYNDISYLVTASDIMIVNPNTMYYTLLNHLDKAPKEAAINTTVSARYQLDVDEDEEDASNALTVYLPGLQNTIQSWFNDFGMLFIAGTETLREKMFDVFDPLWGDRRSFKKILLRQIALLKKDNTEKISWKNQDLSNIKDNFIESSQWLIDDLKKNTLTQWCYSAQNKEFYVDDIPKNIDCSDGVSVTQEQLVELVREEQKELLRSLDMELRYRKAEPEFTIF